MGKVPFHSDESYKVFTSFCKNVQNEKSFCLTKVRSDHAGEFGNGLFGKKNILKKMEFLMISPLQEHLNILLKEIIGLYKKWPTP